MRCEWVDESNPLYVEYHDEEWGVPVYDDRRLFEMLTLEGAQSGLSWATILKKRDGYRRAFHDFDAERVAAFDDGDVARLMQDASIVRNLLKIESTIANARAVLALQNDGTKLSDLLWDLAGGEPQRNAFAKLSDIPAKTPVSTAMSKELKRLGFRFVGPTVCYAMMQAVGMVDDHLVGCFRYGAR